VIDTWLMSCRVVGRGVEKMVLREILHHSALRGFRCLLGTYCPTERNSMVRDNCGKLGFQHIETREGGDSVRQLETKRRRRRGFYASPTGRFRNGSNSRSTDGLSV
jgi:predicted enzyme involved in methoxymalonyl-ACP biosynthesis